MAALALLVASGVWAMIPPHVKSATPPDGATGVALDAEIRLELQTAQEDPGLQLFEAKSDVEVPVRLNTLEKWQHSSPGCSAQNPGCFQMGAHCVYKPVRLLKPSTRYRMSCRTPIPGCSGTFTTVGTQRPKRQVPPSTGGSKRER